MNIIANYLRITNKTKYALSKESGIPYSTVNDICYGKTPLHKCNAETIYRLSCATEISCDNIIASSYTKIPFELFKSNVCHEVKQKGDISFLIDILADTVIRNYFIQTKCEESLYLLGLLDYFSRKNGIPQCADYSARNAIMVRRDADYEEEKQE